MKLKRMKVTLLTAIIILSTVAVFQIKPVEAQPITIEGVISEGEWDSYYLGTSVTAWSGGMSVDVYGFTDDTYLYAAYIADMNEPGWSVAAGMCIGCNFYYKTPQSAEWPDLGYTILGFGGDGIGQTDGNGWNFDSFGGWGIQENEWTDAGIEYYVGDGCYNTVPNPNVAELKIPLSLLTYAGTDYTIMLGGQYWQYDFAQPFYEPPPTEVWVDDGFTDTTTGWNYDHFASIQDGINIVAEGGTVLVEPGIYSEQGQIKIEDKENLLLMSTEGAKATIVRAILIKSDGVTIDGFSAEGPWTTVIGVLGADNCVLKNNIASHGSQEGIGLLTSVNCIVEGNVAVNNRIGIKLSERSKNCAVKDNVAEDNTDAGFYLGKSSDGCTLEDNTASNNGYGIRIVDSDSNTVVKNIVTLNSYHGISVEATYNQPEHFYASSDNVLEGNDISRNGEYGIRFYKDNWMAELSNNRVKFNVIYDNEGGGLLNEGVYPETVDATLNWWGDQSGPYHLTLNPEGVGDAVSDNMQFVPWIGASLTDTKSEEIEVGTDTVDALEEADTEVDYDATAETSIIVASYEENPEEGFTNDAGKYYDVYVETPVAIESLTLKFYYTDADLGGRTESTLSMQWHDGTSWNPCSHQTVHTVSDEAGYSGYIEVTVTDDTYPDLEDLSGTPFGFEGEFPEVADELCDLSVSGEVIVEAAEDATIVYASRGDTAEITVELGLEGYHGDIYFTLYKKVDGGLAYVDEIRTVYGVELKGSRTASWVVDQNPGNYVVWVNIDLMEKVQLTGLDEALHIGPIEVVIT